MSFWNGEEKEFMLEDEVLGIFKMNLNSNGDYIYELELNKNTKEEDLPMAFKTLNNDFISIDMGKEWHHKIMRLWVESRIVPKERHHIEELLEKIGLKFYDEISILKYTSASHIDDKYWVKFNPNDTFEKIKSKFGRS